MADIIDGGIADTQEIRAATLAEPQRIDGRLCELCQIRVCKRARRPLLVECGIWLVAGSFASQGVRKSQVPAFRRYGALGLFVVPIGVVLEARASTSCRNPPLWDAL